MHILAIGSLIFATASAQTGPHAIGPQPGARIPAFSLPDQNGTQRNFDSLSGTKGLMLVFFRSADW